MKKKGRSEMGGLFFYPLGLSLRLNFLLQPASKIFSCLLCHFVISTLLGMAWITHRQLKMLASI
jgi:hypothetical protein